jgi:PRC-barrel domain
MVSSPDLQQLLAGRGIVVDRQGNKIGSAEQLYVDDQTGAPEWVTVKTGLFGTSESFVPLAHSEVRGEELWVAYDKDLVKEAWHGGATDGHLTEDQVAELYRYYGLVSEAGFPSTADVSGEDEDAVGRDVSGPTTDDAQIRSDEWLNVGTEPRESGRVRLRKYVVTDIFTQTIPQPRSAPRA